MKRASFVVIATIAVGLVSAAAASAHVGVSPRVVKAGAKATVSLTIAHGCSGSPTVKVAVKAPASVSGLAALAPKGWAGSVAGSIVTFTGGSLDAKTQGRFAFSFTAPATETTLMFPTVQTCAKGETAWIELPLADGKEPTLPAPFVKVSSAAK